MKYPKIKIIYSLPILLVLLLQACSFSSNQDIKMARNGLAQPQPMTSIDVPPMNTEEYDRIRENEFDKPEETPYSTFSIDVDAAAYANMRRFINQSQMPPADVIRTEELVNYFQYAYPQPQADVPFAIVTELSACPWSPGHQLVHIGLQGKEVPAENLPPSNLVFLLDVSGSMNDYNKLPLLKQAFSLLAEKLRAEDRVAIVVYAGAAGLVLPSTPGDQKWKILQALDKLEAGGSTAGAAGIELAYQVAQENFMENGNNRVIIATDGDFNVGMSSDGALERIIEKKRDSGVYLTVLGFGMGNYKDSKMQILADKGNGNHAYIDNVMEARKVLVKEFGGTLFTIARDVKIQVEFNPELVKGYRLIGYENRMLEARDFNDDKKDAGELGSGHTVTALYELIPAGSDEEIGQIDAPRYQKAARSASKARHSGELMNVKFRYKMPDGTESKLISSAVQGAHAPLAQTSNDFRWSAAVAEFSLILRDSKFKANATYAQVLDLAQGAIGTDTEGYRSEFIGLVKRAQALDSSQPLAQRISEEK
ncbi:MAG TPA: VWA domain-containing protein [Bacteroidetes bacterium]|nr:VWA domain-containing protein [Bacteroidota bacterium]